MPGHKLMVSTCTFVILLLLGCSSAKVTNPVVHGKYTTSYFGDGPTRIIVLSQSSVNPCVVVLTGEQRSKEGLGRFVYYVSSGSINLMGNSQIISKRFIEKYAPLYLGGEIGDYDLWTCGTRYAFRISLQHEKKNMFIYYLGDVKSDSYQIKELDLLYFTVEKEENIERQINSWLIDE